MANAGTFFGPPSLIKGVQGLNGYSVQNLKDANRVLKTYATVGDAGVAGVVSTTLVTLTPYTDTVAGTPNTSFGVTTGKILYLQSICTSWRNNTANSGNVTIRFRLFNGTVLVNSPIHMTITAGTPAPALGLSLFGCHNFPDGIALSGPMQFGVTQQAINTTTGFSLEIVGYEY